jgi:hypothetical protein
MTNDTLKGGYCKNSFMLLKGKNRQIIDSKSNANIDFQCNSQTESNRSQHN